MRGACALFCSIALTAVVSSARAEDKPHWVAHGQEITAAKVGPAAGGLKSLKTFVGGVIGKGKDYPFATWIDKAARYDGFDVPAGHLLIEAVSFTSSLDISAPFPVVLRGVTVRLAQSSPWGILMRPQAGPLFVLWSEAGGIKTGAPTVQTSVDVALDVRGARAVVYHSHLSHAVDGMHVSGSDARIEQNLIDDLVAVPASHNDGIQLLGSPSNVRIAKNRIINTNPQTSCLNLLGRNIIVASNWLAGGGWTVYGGAANNGHAGPAGGPVTMFDNIFARDVFPKVGHFGPVTYWDKAKARRDDWLANRFDDGAPLNP